MVKTEHNLSFIWNFISLNQPLCSSTQLLSQQVDFQVNISQFPRTGESPPLGSLDHSQRGTTCRQVISLVRILGTLKERKQGSGIRDYCPLSACRQTQGVGLRRTGCWMQQSMVGEGKENYWFFLSVPGEMEDLGCLCLAPAVMPICMELFISRDHRVHFGHPEGWNLSCECSGVTVVSWSKVFCQKNIDIMFSEINVPSQCQFPEMCGTYEMHPGEVHPPSIYQGPLVRLRDLSGAFSVFSNTATALLCHTSLWSAEGAPARLSTGWSQKHPPNAFCLGRILFPQTAAALCAALLITPFVRLWFCFPQRRTYFIWAERAPKAPKDVWRDVWHHFECILSLSFSLPFSLFDRNA